MPESERPKPNVLKPSTWSLAMVLGAMLVIIPGLCFGIALPANMGSAMGILGVVWLIVLAAWLLVLLVKFANYLTRGPRH